MQSTNDIELLQLIKSADESAFRCLFERYHRLMFLEARNMLESDEEAKDSVQEIFMWVWQKREKLTIQYSFRNYLVQAVRYNCSNKLKAHATLKKRQRRYSADLMDIFTNNIHLENKELNQQIMSAIEKVPPARRSAFKKSFLEGKSLSEIAEEMGISLSTVKNSIGEAVKTLREKLKNIQ